MATTHYFRHNVKSEQNLYEDLIIESMQMFGQDCYYLPREVVHQDMIFDDTILSKFEYALKIEMYIESIEGFDGDGDLFSKFGVEIRDAVTLVMSRRRWNTLVPKFYSGPTDINDRERNVYYRPREGDVIHIPMADATFQIQKVEDENPFYQLGHLPTFKMRCEKFEYSDERFNTGVPEIDQLNLIGGYQYRLHLDSNSNGWEIGERVIQENNHYTIEGTVVEWMDSDKTLYLGHVGADREDYKPFVVGNSVRGTSLFNSIATPVFIDEVQNIQPGTPGGANEAIPSFDISAFEYVDFSEKNIFGDIM